MNKLAEKISLFFADKEHRIGELVLDAIIKESHELKAEISEHPTESGDSFVDHVSQCLTTLQIEGIISNTPLTLIGMTAVASLDNYLHDRSNNRAEQAFKKLEDIFAKRSPISIASSLKQYDNIVLESLCVERGGGNSESLHFRTTAKQVRIVNQATISLPKPKPERAKIKKHMGKQESKPASVEVTKKTADKQSAFDALLNW